MRSLGGCRRWEQTESKDYRGDLMHGNEAHGFSTLAVFALIVTEPISPSERAVWKPTTSGACCRCSVTFWWISGHTRVRNLGRLLYL